MDSSRTQVVIFYDSDSDQLDSDSVLCDLEVTAPYWFVYYDYNCFVNVSSTGKCRLISNVLLCCCFSSVNAELYERFVSSSSLDSQWTWLHACCDVCVYPVSDVRRTSNLQTKCSLPITSQMSFQSMSRIPDSPEDVAGLSLQVIVATNVYQRYLDFTTNAF